MPGLTVHYGWYLCVIKTEFLIIDQIMLLINILVKFQPDVPILLIMGGGLTRYGPNIGVPARIGCKWEKMMPQKNSDPKP
jgi:hypothetical protein